MTMFHIPHEDLNYFVICKEIFKTHPVNRPFMFLCREILRGHRNARLDKTRQAMALLEIRKKEQEALLLPEMDIIKRDLCSKRR